MYDLCVFLLDPFATVFGTGSESESFVGGFADFRNLEKVNLIPLEKTWVGVQINIFFFFF